MQKMAADIFSGMVMEEAIKDKTIQVKQQLKDEQTGTLLDPNNVVEYKAYMQAKNDQNRFDDDDDEQMDEEEEKILRGYREQRLAQMKQQYSEHQDNLIKGHGEYQEITEQEFLPNVTKSKYTVVHFYHKDFERCKIVDMHLR